MFEYLKIQPQPRQWQWAPPPPKIYNHVKSTYNVNSFTLARNFPKGTWTILVRGGVNWQLSYFFADVCIFLVPVGIKIMFFVVYGKCSKNWFWQLFQRTLTDLLSAYYRVWINEGRQFLVKYSLASEEKVCQKVKKTLFQINFFTLPILS